MYQTSRPRDLLYLLSISTLALSLFKPCLCGAPAITNDLTAQAHAGNPAPVSPLPYRLRTHLEAFRQLYSIDKFVYYVFHFFLLLLVFNVSMASSTIST